MSMSLQFSSLSYATSQFSPKLNRFHCPIIPSVRCAATGDQSASVAVAVADHNNSSTASLDTKEIRKNFTRRSNYNKKGFGRKDETLEHLSTIYASEIIKTLRANENEYTWGNVTLKLAESYGWCWGVERAVQLVFEAKQQFPQQKIWITNEIIHNPVVTQQFESMDIEFLPIKDGKKQYEVIEKGDIVMLPAHGVAAEEMLVLNDQIVQIVDTTCPWVSKVWNTVEKHKKEEFTSIIHGKYSHQEIIGTSSFAGKHVIVKNIEEASYVCDYILEGKLNGSSSTKEAFLEKFKYAVSKGFDPDSDLVKIGIANQTTMIKGETEEIGKLAERTMMHKHGVENINNHFMSFNTICDATEERQDALFKLAENKLDLIIVVGGWNSDNTSHLQRLAEESGIPSYWVDTHERILSPQNKITYKLHHGELVEKENWLPHGPIKIGVTSGASNPDKVLEDVLNKVFGIKEKESVA